MKNKTKINKPVSGNEIAKVPVIFQLEALECGAACLDMILAYYNKWIPLDVIRNDCGVSRDGSNAANIYMCAQKYDLDVKAYGWDFKTLREKGTFPCICYWDFAHFIVVDGFKKNKVVVNDPASGRVEVPFARFSEGYSNTTLIFSPSEHFKPSGEKTNIFKFAKEFFIKFKKPITILSLLILLIAVLGISIPLFSQYFYDRLLPEGTTIDQFTPFIIALGGVYLLIFIIQSIQAIYSFKVGKLSSEKMSNNFMIKLFKLPMSFFSQRFKGDIVSRQKSSENIASTVIAVSAPLTVNFLSLIFYLIVMFYYSWQLAIIGIVSVVINTYISFFISNKRVDVTKGMNRDACSLRSNTISSFEMMDTIKSSGAEDEFYGKWQKLFFASLFSKNKVYSKNAFLNLIPEFISTALGTIVIALGTVFVIVGAKTSSGAIFSIGIVTAFEGFYNSFSKPVLNLISSSQKIIELRTDIGKFDDVRKYPDDINIEEREDKPTVELSGDIEIKNVTFGYARLGEPLIKNLSIHIKPGDKIAFVGPSGCGKSTIANLISGLYNPWEGQILFDGKERNELSRKSFTQQISVVDQNITLFSDTIKNNLTLWDDNIPLENIEKASEDAQILDFVNSRENQFEHLLKENGGDFSGGQRQSMEIARGLATNPKILILDEATSALDAQTEDAIIKAIKKRNITTILVAHRLSTIRDADQIFVLKDGKIVESGNHDSLLKLNGVYAELVRND